MKRWTVVALLCLSTVAGAQTSAAKKELVAKVLQLQQPAVLAAATQLAQQPAVQITQQAGMALQQRIPPEKREAVAKEIQEDLNRYTNEAVPILRDRATKLAPTTIGPLLEEKFTEDELKQLISIMESPVNKKFIAMGGEMHKSLIEKVVAESRPQIDPKIRTLQQSIAGRLGLSPTESAPPAAGAPAKPASKP